MLPSVNYGLLQDGNQHDIGRCVDVVFGNRLMLYRCQQVCRPRIGNYLRNSDHHARCGCLDIGSVACALLCTVVF